MTAERLGVPLGTTALAKPGYSGPSLARRFDALDGWPDPWRCHSRKVTRRPSARSAARVEATVLRGRRRLQVDCRGKRFDAQKVEIVALAQVADRRAELAEG